jgi:hypothetical protein
MRINYETDEEQKDRAGPQQRHYHVTSDRGGYGISQLRGCGSVTCYMYVYGTHLDNPISHSIRHTDLPVLLVRSGQGLSCVTAG